MNIIEVKNLKKSFSDVVVLDGVTFSIEKGEVVAVIGPSGSGKSTMLRCLINLEKADSGTILIEDIPLIKDGCYSDEKERHTACAKMGMVFQSFNLFPHLSVLNNLIYAPINVKKQDKSSATTLAFELLQKVGLAGRENAMPSELSGGQKQRVAIARALMMAPDILLFDEPTSSLDPELTNEVLTVIKNLAAEKMTMMVVTHEMGFAREVASRVMFMDNKRIVADDTPKNIFCNPSTKRIADFIGM